MSPIQTLHSHTVLSDGKLTFEEFLHTAEKESIGLVIFTDHDTLPSKEILENLKRQSFETKWAMGIEISSGAPKESPATESSVHLLGLFVDPFNADLADYCHVTREKREQRMRQMVKNFQRYGFDITPEECLAQAGPAVVASPHIVNALLVKEKNKALMDQFLEKLKKEAEENERAKKLYEGLLRKPASQIPYVLFIGDDPYIPDIAVNIPDKPDFDEGVRIIRNAGGIATIAHYFSIKPFMSLDLIEKLLVEKRLDGMETVYGLNEWNSPVHEEYEADRTKIKELVKRHNKIATGGADAHYRTDIENFAKNTAYADETRGMSEHILENYTVNTDWSSL